MRSTALPAKLLSPLTKCESCRAQDRQFLCRRRKPRYPCFIARDGSKRRRPLEVPLQRGCQGFARQVVEIAESAVKQSLDKA